MGEKQINEIQYRETGDTDFLVLRQLGVSQLAYLLQMQDDKHWWK